MELREFQFMTRQPMILLKRCEDAIPDSTDASRFKKMAYHVAIDLYTLFILCSAFRCITEGPRFSFPDLPFLKLRLSVQQHGIFLYSATEPLKIKRITKVIKLKRRTAYEGVPTVNINNKD